MSNCLALRTTIAPHALAPLAAALASLVSASSVAASLALDTSPIVLGRVESVGVTLRVEEPPGSEHLPLRLSVNVGSFSGAVRVEPGVYKATYTPPSTRFPQVALVAAWRETGPDAPIDFLRIPLHGTTRIDAVAPPGSEVRALVGSTEFGPMTANARGQVTLPVDVPPDVPVAVILVKDRSGATIRRTATVSVPPYNRLTVALVPYAVLANGEDWVRVEVFYETPTPVPPQKIAIVPSEGSVTLLRTAPSRFVFKYLPPAGSVSRESTFQVGVEGDSAAKGQASVSLGLPPPAQVDLIVPPKPLFCDGRTSAPLQVRVYDAKGLGLPHQHLEVMANGHLIRDVSYKGAGVYEAQMVAPASYPDNGLVRLSATVLKPDGQAVASTANYRVLPLPLPSSITGEVSPRPVLADGQSKAAITLDVRDKAGMPLKGAQLLAVASHGRASPVLEIGEGRYRVDYVPPESLPPNDEALVRIVDSSNAFESVVPVPLRKDQRLFVGLRGGFTHSLKDLSGPRAGLDVLVPFRVGKANLAIEAAATVGGTTQHIATLSGSSRSEAEFVPASLRVAWAPLVTKRVAAFVGVGGVVTWARVRNDANGYDAVKVGFGGMGFVSGAFNLGPGQAFLEGSWSYAPVEHSDFRLDAGGLGVEIGYRFGLF